MNWFSAHLPILPEVIVLSMSCIILLASAYIQKNRYLAYLLAQVTVIGAVYACFFVTYNISQATSLFNHSFVWDRMTLLMTLASCLGMFLVYMFARQYNEEHDIMNCEFYVLSLLSLLGMMVLISATSLLTLYLGLELMSLPLYAMVALKRAKERCIEAAIKYFVMGAIASGILLYGFSLLFGVAQSLDLRIIANVLTAPQFHASILVIFACVFIIAGMAFKLGAVPFHMWVPDVYDGAPNSVTLFISSIPKLAVFVLLARLVSGPLSSVMGHWDQVLVFTGVLSVVVGNIVAVVQNNIKRMLAYSSIAHMGYMLLGLATLSPRGHSAALFYMITYVLVSLSAFGVITAISRRGLEITMISDLTGLSKRNPWVSFMMMLIMFSLAGVPPLVGFIAKIDILEALIQANMVWAAVIAIIFAIVGAYYYIRVVKVMYFDDQPSSSPLDDVVYCASESYLAITLCGVAILLLGMFPDWLFNICRATLG